MKKTMALVVFALAVCVLFSGVVVGQQAEKKEVSKKFLNTWKKIGDKTKEIRSFKTEKATTVAGVRGAEAEDEALKHLYFKGGVKYPSRMELKNAVDMLEAFISENPKDENIAETKYFLTQCYMQLGEVEKAKTTLNDLVKNHANTDFGDMAAQDLASLKK